MPITENPAFSLIQQEINDCAQREKEYQLMRTNLLENNNNNCVNNNNNEKHIANGNAKEEHVVQNGNHVAEEEKASEVTKQPDVINQQINNNNANDNRNKQANGFRKFLPNPAVRGIMHQFIKSRGKLTPNKMERTFQPQYRWSIPDVIDTSKMMTTTTMMDAGGEGGKGGEEPVLRIRKGYVPVEERMKQEFMDIRNREIELKNVRKQSDAEFSSLDDYETSESIMSNGNKGLRRFKSMMQLGANENGIVGGDHDDYVEPIDRRSPMATLKPARSLAELCDVDQEELTTTPSTLIRRWETIIRESQERN